MEADAPFRKAGMRLLGGMTLYNAADINTQIGAAGALSNGLHFGAALGYRFSPKFGLQVRAEYILKSVNVIDGSSNTHVMNYTSIPVMLGMTWSFVQTEKTWVSLILAGGMGLATRLSSADQSITSGDNITRFEASAITFLAGLQLDIFAGEKFSFFVEGGYRYLRSAAMTPISAPAGTNLFATAGDFVPLPLDMSGMEISGGIQFLF